MSGELGGVAEFLLPRLRLFLSVDLVGSTALKHSGSFPVTAPKHGASLSQLGAQWFNPMAHFYRRIERLFEEEWEKYLSHLSQEIDWPEVKERPELWKINGDELIYVMILENPTDAYIALMIWMRTLRQYRVELQKIASSLDIKATAWTAGFPIGNMEFAFIRHPGSSNAKNISAENEQGPDQIKLSHFNLMNFWYEEKNKNNGFVYEIIKDYIGPSMDIGFRLSSLSTPRQFTISIEVATLLTQFTAISETVIGRLRDRFSRIRIFFKGRESLKGVFGGQNYPVFWIDMFDNNFYNAEDILLNMKETKPDELKKYCEYFYEENGTFFFPPFIYDSSKPAPKAVPQNYIGQIIALNSKWVQEKERYLKEKEDQMVNFLNENGETDNNKEESDISKFATSLNSVNGIKENKT